MLSKTLPREVSSPSPSCVLVPSSFDAGLSGVQTLQQTVPLLDQSLPICADHSICELPIHIHFPNISISPPAQPLPWILFLSGYGAVSKYYDRWGIWAATNKLIFVQYDLPSFSAIPAEDELDLLPTVSAFLSYLNSDPSSPLFSRVSLNEVLLAGHSRGGMIGALHFARNPAINALYLIDPVDAASSTSSQPGSFLKTLSRLPLLGSALQTAAPSAIQELATTRIRSHPVPLGMSRSEFLGPCTGSASRNADAFFNVSGVWDLEVVGAGHTEFLEAGEILDKLFDLICRVPQHRDRKEVIDLTAGPMIAWLKCQVGRDGCQCGDIPKWAVERQSEGQLKVITRQSETVSY